MLSTATPTGSGCTSRGLSAKKGMAAATTMTKVQKSFIVNVLTSIKRENQAKLRSIMGLGEIDCSGDFLAQIDEVFPLFLIKRPFTV